MCEPLAMYFQVGMEKKVFSILCMACFVGAGLMGPGEAVSADSSKLGDSMARWLSPEIRRLDAEIATIGQTLADCPPWSVGHQSQRLGCHSVYHSMPDRLITVVIDLGQVRQIDAIAMIPVHLALGRCW